MSRWTLVAVLGVLSVCAGCALGTALTGKRIDLAVGGGLLLSAGTGLAHLRFRAEEPLSEELLSQLAQRESYKAAVQSAPRLGELLVYHYHWISRRDLDRALARQKRTGRRLGEILIRMRVISVQKLTRALLEHRALKGEAPPLTIPENWTGRREPW